MAVVKIGRGLELPNRVGLASGTAGYGFELERIIDIRRIGALYTKGTTLLPRAGNRPPRLAEVGTGLINSIGLQNPGVEHLAEVYAPRYRGWPTRIIANIAGADTAEYVRCVSRLNGVDGIHGIELNISCPNIAHGLDIGRDPALAAALMEAVRAVSELPIIVKLSPNVTDIGAIAKAVVEAGADAISAVNTYVGMVVSHSGRPLLSSATGGMSGPAIKPLALAAVARVRAAVAVPIIGIGGIWTADDAREFLAVGADAVQVGTASFAEPSRSLEILDALEAATA